MRGLLRSAALCALIGAATIGNGWSSATAATIVGTAFSSNCLPFGCNDSGTSVGPNVHYQQIYLAAAFSGPINIDTISFFDSVSPGASVLSGDYAITFSTTAAPLNSSYPIAGTGTLPFFAGHLSGGAFGSRFTISGGSFAYDPALGNLLMDVIASNQPNVPSASAAGYFNADLSGITTRRAYLITGQAGTQDIAALVTGFNLSPVPLPGAFPLLSAGLVALTLFRRKVQS